MFETATEDKETKVKVVNPTDFFTYSENKHQSDKQVKWFYLDQISHCRIVLVNLARTENSVGTGQELQHAFDKEIPIIGFGDENVYPWLKVDCQCIFPSMLQAIDYIIDNYC